jgi:hypothetical protein
MRPALLLGLVCAQLLAHTTGDTVIVRAGLTRHTGLSGDTCNHTLTKLCGDTKSIDRKLCEQCLQAHSSEAAKANCSSAQLADFCGGDSTLWFVTGGAQNDVLDQLRASLPEAAQQRIRNTKLLRSALDTARDGDAVLVLAAGYPWRRTALPDDLYEVASFKHLQLFLEYPDAIADFDVFVTPPQHAPRAPTRCTATETPMSCNNFFAPGATGCLPQNSGLPGDSLPCQQLLLNVSAAECQGACEVQGQNGCCEYKTAGTASVCEFYTFGSPIPCADGKSCDSSWDCTGGAAPPPPPPASITAQVSWKQRAVVTTDAAGRHGLSRGSIMMAQGAYHNGWCTSKCDKLDMISAGCRQACNSSILAMAQVAGVYKASYGVPPALQTPILFTHAGHLIATTKLSNMISGRFGPASSWLALWRFILESLGLPATIASKMRAWVPTVRPTYPAPDVLPHLPPTSAMQAVVKSARWLVNGSKLLSDGSALDGGKTTCCLHDGAGSQNVCTYKPCRNDQVCTIGNDTGRILPAGVTNITCIQEGWSSILHWNGSQHRMATFVRTDGQSEAAMGLAVASVMLSHDAEAVSKEERAQWMTSASALMDYLWRWSDSQSINRTDETFGIVWWNQRTPGPFAHFADVSGKSLPLPCILVLAPLYVLLHCFV